MGRWSLNFDTLVPHALTHISPQIVEAKAVQWLDFANTQITDLSHIAGMTWIIKLALDGTQISDLRPVLGLTDLRDDPDFMGLSIQGCAACKIDPQIDAISRIKDNTERAAAFFDYLADWVPPWEEDTPNDGLLPVAISDGKPEIAESLPTEAERDERLKQVLHQRLIPEVDELAQLAGNRFARTARLARSLQTLLDRPFEALDMLNIHLDIEALQPFRDRDAEREMGEPFNDELKNALSQVLRTGPGLTLDTPDMEKLLARINRFRSAPQAEANRAIHNALSLATSADVAAIGDHLRA